MWRVIGWFVCNCKDEGGGIWAYLSISQMTRSLGRPAALCVCNLRQIPHGTAAKK